jgi:hypothetical protein
MGLQHPRHLRLRQTPRVAWRGGQLQEIPEPGCICGRTQREQRCVKTGQLLPQLVRRTPELGEQRFFRPAEFAYHQEVRRLYMDLAKAGPVCPSGIRSHKGIASVILGASHCVAVAKPVELLGVNRTDMQAPFHEQFDDGTPWYLDGDRHTVHRTGGQGC